MIKKFEEFINEAYGVDMSQVGKEMETYLLGLCNNEIEINAMKPFIKRMVNKSQVTNVNYTVEDIENILKRLSFESFEDMIKNDNVYYRNYGHCFNVDSLSKSDVDIISGILKRFLKGYAMDMSKKNVGRIIRIFVEADTNENKIDVVGSILAVFAGNWTYASIWDESDIHDILEESGINMTEVDASKLYERFEYIVGSNNFDRSNSMKELRSLMKKDSISYRDIVKDCNAEKIFEELCVSTSNRIIKYVIGKYFFATNKVWDNEGNKMFKELPIVRDINGKLITGEVYYCEALDAYAKDEDDFNEDGYEWLAKEANEEGILDDDQPDWMDNNWDMLDIYEVDLDKEFNWTEK